MTKLTNEQIKEGTGLSIDNAQNLYTVAEELGKKGTYGMGSGLMVLSAEESIKAFGLMSRGAVENEWSLELNKYFRSHKHKHNSASLFLIICTLMEEMIGEIEDIENDSNITPENCTLVLSKRVKSNMITKLSQGDENLMSIVDWQGSADDMKKQGLYVDFNNDQWISPNSVTEIQYIHHRDIAFKLLSKIEYVYQTIPIDVLQSLYSNYKTNQDKSNSI